MTTTRSCEATFIFNGAHISHSLYILDNLAIEQELVLGMDFLVQHGALMLNRTITIPPPTVNEVQHTIPRLVHQADIVLDAGMNKSVWLTPCVGYDLPKQGAIGYVYPHMALLDGIILWQGIQTADKNGIRVYLTNTTSHTLTINGNTPLGIWELDVDGDIRDADTLVRDALKLKTQLTQSGERWSCSRFVTMEEPMSVLKLSATDNGERWEWDDEHFYLDKSRTPLGLREPPVEAEIGHIKTAWEEAMDTLKLEKKWTTTHALRQIAHC